MLQSAFLIGMTFFNLAGVNYDSDGRIEFCRNEVFIPVRLGGISLYKDCDGFYVVKNGQRYDVQNWLCDPFLLKMSDEQLMNFLGRNKPKIIFLNHEQFEWMMQGEEVEITGVEKERFISQLSGEGQIVVNQLDNGEYILHAQMRLLGGGRDEAGNLLNEGVREGTKMTVATIAGNAAITAVTTAVKHYIATSAAQAIVAAGGPSAATIATALAGQTGVGGAALAGAISGACSVLPAVVLCFPFVVLGYVCIKTIVARSSEPVAPQTDSCANTQSVSSERVNADSYIEEESHEIIQN